MKTKNILLAILSLITFASYAQTEKEHRNETKKTITELKIEKTSLEEFNNLDWNVLSEMFKDNDENQEITLVFSYVNNSEVDTSEPRVDNFEVKITGKTSELENLIYKLNKTMGKLYEFKEKNKK